MLIDQIKKLATEKGMTLHEVSEKSGVKYTGLIEWGRRCEDPASGKVLAVANVLGTTVEELLRQEETA